MIISISLLYFFGNSVDSLDALIEVFGVDLYDDMPFYIVVGDALLFGSHGLYCIIYYNFCKEYQKIFNKIILRKTPETIESSIMAGSMSKTR